MAAELIEGPELTRDKGSVRADFTFRLTGLQYDRLELSWWDPVSAEVGEDFSGASIVNVEGKDRVVAPLYVPEGYFTGDKVVTFRLKDANEADSDPLWQQDYRLLEGPSAQAT